MKTLILIHGRSWKPPRDDLETLWLAALVHGLRRDHDGATLARFESANKTFVYYGDVSNECLSRKTGQPIPPNDIASRRQTLAALKEWRTGQFNKRHYNALPGKESLKEGAADVLAPLLHFFRLSDELIGAVAPDIGEYWRGDASDFGSRARAPLIKPLRDAFDRGDSICVLAHSLGSMIAYDTLWKFSHRGEYRAAYRQKKIDLLLSIGSPLADETVKDRLFGAAASGARRYPNNINAWINVAAEDDYISHDSTVAGDYRSMKRLGLIERITDHKIYNLAVRDGKSNPHHSSGYLLHPTVSKAIADWLSI